MFRGLSCGNIRGNEVFMASLTDGRWSSRPEAPVRGIRVGSPRDRLKARLPQNSALSVTAIRDLRPKRLVCLAQVFAVIFSILLCVCAPLSAQTDINDVHVVPRLVPKSKDAKNAKDAKNKPNSEDEDKGVDDPNDPVAPAIEPVANAANPAATAPPPVNTPPVVSAHLRPMKVDVDLVLVPVTITDPMNRLVTGLEKDNFQLYEGNTQQQIKTFSSEDAPVSIGVIFDSSGSMASKMDRAKEAVVEFFKTANPQDEFFMITFSDEPEVIADFTNSVDEIQNKLIYAVPRKRTALLDAIYMGLSKMREAKYPKKALLIISDGGDNHSRYTENEIKANVKEADVMIYAIGIYDRYASAMEERLGPQLLSDMCEISGGRAFTIDNPNDLADVATKIGIELRNQYVLGYRPNKILHDGKWRKIKVKLLPPKGLPPLKVYARTGYYAPAE
jgi:Ca-activated chloride channel family protein